MWLSVGYASELGTNALTALCGSRKQSWRVARALVHNPLTAALG